MPECPIPLLSRDLLSKLDVQIIFKGGEVKLLVPETKAIEARTFMLQGKTESNNLEGVPEKVQNAVNTPDLG